MKFPLSGFALLNKPAGMSSFKAVSILKKKLNTKKAGHTGTLDPFAEGLLVILIGDMTRFFDFFMNFRKTYTAEAVFGEEKDTEDITGETSAVSAFLPDFSTISSKASLFRGEIKQIPPVYSAVHVNGKRAYQLAREGIKADLKPRNSFIYSLDLNSYNDNILNFTVSCSSGTYIRSIARDLARECGSAAFLKSLVRTDIGSFSIKYAVSPDDFRSDMLISPYNGIKQMGISTVTVKDSFRDKMLNGIQPDSESFTSAVPDGPSAVFDSENNFTAFIEKTVNEFRYRFVIPERSV